MPLSVKKGKSESKKNHLRDLAEGQHVKDTKRGVLGTILFKNSDGTYGVSYSGYPSQYRVPREHLEEVVPRIGSNPGVLF